MSYKTILVHITPGTRCLVRLEMAIDLARSFDASLLAVHALLPYTPPGYIMPQIVPEILQAQQKTVTELMANTEKDLRKHASSLGFEAIEWINLIHDPLDALCMRAKYADLVVIGQSDPDDTSGTPLDFPERLVLSAGRPVLIVPNIGSFPTMGKIALIAWNASREATRAVTDAIPLLKRAKIVHVMAVGAGHGEQGNIPGTEVANYLARHGINVDVIRDPGGEIDIGNELLSRAADMSADLIVMGGYGHSRLREWVLGGATKTILESMTAPVLMSH